MTLDTLPDHGISTRGGIDERWQDRAKCKDLDPAWLFPEEIRGTKRRTDITAYVINSRCLRCDVAELCLDEAEALGERFGIRGGYSAPERGWAAKR